MLHSLIPFVKEANTRSMLNHITGGPERTERDWMPRETLLSLNADKLFPQPKDSHYLRGKRQHVC